MSYQNMCQRISILSIFLDKLRKSAHPYDKFCGRLFGMSGETLITNSTLLDFLKFREHLCKALRVGKICSSDKMSNEIIRDYTINFSLIKDYLKLHSRGSFDFEHEFKTEILKLVQTRDLQRTMTNSGVPLLSKSDGSRMVHPLITSVLDSVHSTDFKQFVSFLWGIFQQYDPKNTQKSRIR